MINIFKTKYRIVRDNYAGYEVQKRSALGLWNQWPETNTHKSLDEAKEYLEKNKFLVVYEE